MSLLLLSALLGSGTGLAADHAEAPGTQADPAADINDFYAWHTSNGTIVAVISFAPLLSPGTAALYDEDVLYTIHIDTNDDYTPDIEIYARFGQATDGSWGIQVENLPGASGTVSGPVETVLTDGDIKVWAGLREDPFFFDGVGFGNTLATGTVAFTGADAFAGYNVSAIVVEFDTAATTGSAHTIQAWASTARK